MGALPVTSSSRKYLHYAVGAIGALVAVYASLVYFRPLESQGATPPPFVQYESYGTASVVCGAPDPLVQYLMEGSTYAKRFTLSNVNGGTQVLASCSSPFGGMTQYISMRRSIPNSFVSYRIKVDGLPFIEIYNPTETGEESILPSGWVVGESTISTTLPIKFKSSLVIEAEVRGQRNIETPVTLYTGAHVMFQPLISEEALPVRFLKPQEIKFEAGTTPTVNVGNSPTVNIGGQPIHTVTP